MSRRRLTPTPDPPTLAWLSRDVAAISARCLWCGWLRELPLAPLLEAHGETRFPDFAKRLRCGSCGSREVEARPAWPDPAAAQDWPNRATGLRTSRRPADTAIDQDSADRASAGVVIEQPDRQP